MWPDASTGVEKSTGNRSAYSLVSFFGKIDYSWRNLLLASFTIRRDGSSRFGRNNRYGTFPAATLGYRISENLKIDWLNDLKIRASWGKTGNQAISNTARYALYVSDYGNDRVTSTAYDIYLQQSGIFPSGYLASQTANDNLKWETTIQYNAGVDFGMFNSRLFGSVDAYIKDVKDMLISPAYLGSMGEGGASWLNGPSLRNWGMEFALNYGHTWGNFTWNTGLTYSFNRNKITELADNAVNPVTGERFSMDVLDMGGLGSTRFLLKKGGTMGDIYSTIDLVRDSNGAIYVDETNAVSTSAIQDKEDYIKLGTVLPKGNLAWNNSFSWKNFGASFMVNARFGGKVFSRTQAVLDFYGVSENSAVARDNGFVTLNNGDLVDPQMWYSIIAGGTAVPQYYIYDATNIRLGEVTVSYNVPRRWLGNVCDIKVSFVGRNLWMIYNKAPFDPESVASTDNWYQGIDYFMMPSMRSFGFNVNFTF